MPLIWPARVPDGRGLSEPREPPIFERPMAHGGAAGVASTAAFPSVRGVEALPGCPELRGKSRRPFEIPLRAFCEPAAGLPEPS